MCSSLEVVTFSYIVGTPEMENEDNGCDMTPDITLDMVSDMISDMNSKATTLSSILIYY